MRIDDGNTLGIVVRSGGDRPHPEAKARKEDSPASGRQFRSLSQNNAETVTE
jgi:hypothetical protein